jgi:N-acetylglucosaminyldiphosphoundecaprenol N-acetyl-beta-D-mannosaminyltransferase
LSKTIPTPSLLASLAPAAAASTPPTPEEPVRSTAPDDPGIGRARLSVGPFLGDDLDARQAVEAAVDLAVAATDRPVRAYALHVGGLNAHEDEAFVAEMRDAELVYADGGSVVLLGRLAGSRRLQRAPTTDIGWDVLHGISDRLGRPARIALIGGPPGLAARAGQALVDAGAGVVVFETDGYVDDWAPVLERLADVDVDVCIVGLGAPREMLWVQTWLAQLPPALILTCGGWFGFLAGDEKRARGLLRLPGLEWIARVAQSPRRLGGRYVRGTWVTLRLATGLAVGRLRA